MEPVAHRACRAPSPPQIPFPVSSTTRAHKSPESQADFGAIRLLFPSRPPPLPCMPDKIVITRQGSKNRLEAPPPLLWSPTISPRAPDSAPT